MAARITWTLSHRTNFEQQPLPIAKHSELPSGSTTCGEECRFVCCKFLSDWRTGRRQCDWFLPILHSGPSLGRTSSQDRQAVGHDPFCRIYTPADLCPCWNNSGVNWNAFHLISFASPWNSVLLRGPLVYDFQYSAWGIEDSTPGNSQPVIRDRTRYDGSDRLRIVRYRQFLSII